MQRKLVIAAALGAISSFPPGTRGAMGAERMECSQTDLFVHEGADWYRIPSVVVTGKGAILAFASRRKGGKGDFGHETDVVLRRSTDGGETFSPMQTLVTRKDTDIHHGPAVIDSKTGRVFKFCRYWPARSNPQGVVGSTPYEKMVELGWHDHLVYSDDDGKTWSDPQPLVLDFPKGATSAATGNGIHGVQLPDGRLLIQGGYVLDKTRYICVFHSDDTGETWKRGASAPLDDIVREFPMAVNADGSVYINVRSNRKRRWIGVSRDRGESFGEFAMDKALPDPACHAGLVRMPDSTMVFSNPAGPGRSNLTVRLSDDEGETWAVAKLIHTGPSAYSDVAAGANGALYCLYEGGSEIYGAITMARFNVADLRAGAKSASAGSATGPAFHVQDLFRGVRIPNVVVTTGGTVLAFAKSGHLVRRSEDRGETWSEAAEVGEDAGGSAIVDQVTGDIMVVRSKKGYLWRSSDDGKTWKREEITIKPNAVGHGSPDTVGVQTTCSESGVTLMHGKHKGRLLMPARIQPPNGTNDQEYWVYNYNTAIYSDDRGKTWQTSTPVQSGTGEGTLAELSDGRIYYNSRCHMAVDHRRRIAWSHNDGEMFVDWQVSEHLFEIGEPFYFKYGTKPSYGCNAGLIRMPLQATGGKDVLLFSTPDNPGGHRFRMTVWASFDGAKTWPVKRLVNEGASAYSSLAAGKDGTIYLLFERGEKKLYDTMAVARFNLDWLAGDHDWRALFP